MLPSGRNHYTEFATRVRRETPSGSPLIPDRAAFFAPSHVFVVFLPIVPLVLFFIVLPIVFVLVVLVPLLLFFLPLLVLEILILVQSEDVWMPQGLFATPDATFRH